MTKLFVAIFCLIISSVYVHAIQTEHIGMEVLPAPGEVTVDGKIDDWDLTGGVFICGDVINARENASAWFHAMYDEDYVYFLVRFNDPTPMNHQGSIAGDPAWRGDCVQLRMTTHPDDSDLQLHIWLDAAYFSRDKQDIISIDYPMLDRRVPVDNALEFGALQAFRVYDDESGYIQEMAVPWDLLTLDEQPLKPGDEFRLGVEPQFTIGETLSRVQWVDVFMEGVTPSRSFSWSATRSWGRALLKEEGDLDPRPVRLADGREFPVSLQKGKPVVDWAGLIEVEELKGFVPITFHMPEDGYISLNIYDEHGVVVRHLLNHAFYPAGEHEVMWDGLTTPNLDEPGQPAHAGEYTWKAIRHRGIGLRLRGWAHNAGSAPWDDGPTTNWGGDHGNPVAAASDDNKVYLGWSGSEAGDALVACDLEGNVLWRSSRTGMAGADQIAVDRETVYVQHWNGNIYRVDAEEGRYTSWEGRGTTDLFVNDLWEEGKENMPESASGMYALDGRLYLSFTNIDLVMMLDGDTGEEKARFKVPAPADIAAETEDCVYVVSETENVVALDPSTGDLDPVITGLSDASGIALDADGNFYVGVRETDNQVKVFSSDGEPAGTIGKPGGRALIGPWEPDGMAFIAGITVDAEGKLWVTENDSSPRRISVWDTGTGEFVKEFFGPTGYGAPGGSINPLDPDIMVGNGAEWRLDPETGRAGCLGTIHRGGMSHSQFGIGENDQLYLAVAPKWWHGPVYIYERLGDADYALRSKIWAPELVERGSDPREGEITVKVWADENGDEEIQPGEVSEFEIELGGWIVGWYMPMNQDLTFYGSLYKLAVTDFTEVGAPVYDLSKAHKLPHPEDVGSRGAMGAKRGMGSADGRLMLYNGRYGREQSDFVCYDIETGQRMWAYPNNYVGVHGSHRAPSAQTALIRGAYDIAGSVELSEPVGNVWVIPTNVGEWHVLSEDGFYLTSLFEGDPLRRQWPQEPVRGAVMDNVPPGQGAEDFGGNISQGQDGNLYLQAGKTGFWNVKVVGLDTVEAVEGQAFTFNEDDIIRAKAFRDDYRQVAFETRRMTVRKMTLEFTGDFDQDFPGSEIIEYQVQADAAVRSAAVYDDNYLYLGWDVKDSTPWLNAAGSPDEMYTKGDTVDFQIGADPEADPARSSPVLGDLRLSIGNFDGEPTAVVYRKVAEDKNPMTFYSGVVRDGYLMESVIVLKEAQIEVDVRSDGYTVQAAVPLDTLGLGPEDGLELSGDFGVTHSDGAGRNTALRTYWNNQGAGIVADEVFELQYNPAHWGRLVFEE